MSSLGDAANLSYRPLSEMAARADLPETLEVSTSPSDVPRDEARAFRRASASVAAALVGTLFYAVDRTRAFLQHGPPNPLQNHNPTGRIEYFWRVGLSAFAASVVFLLVMNLLRSRERETFQMLSRAMVPVVIVASILAVAFP